jgi:hypothetical protein
MLQWMIAVRTPSADLAFDTCRTLAIGLRDKTAQDAKLSRTLVWPTWVHGMTQPTILRIHQERLRRVHPSSLLVSMLSHSEIQGIQTIVSGKHVIGSAVYIYGILSHSKTYPVSQVDLYFFIDGVQVGTFNMAPDGDSTYSYNQLLYANSSMVYASHAITLQNGRVGGPISLTLLDYLIYST